MSVPLIAHIVHRFDVGGLENGVVNLINAIPAHRYRHAIVCMTDYNPDFAARIQRSDVELIALHKREGKDLGVYGRCLRALRALRPAIVHTRNTATLEMQAVAWWAGVPARIHGEHGRDIHDLEGRLPRYNRLRRALRPLVHRYIALSQDLAFWLGDTVRVRANRVVTICNGVDHTRFHPPLHGRETWPNLNWGPDTVVIGAVGRMQTVKDPINLAHAFLLLRERVPDLWPRLRLAMIGAGPLRDEAEQVLQTGGAEAQIWLPGSRNDTAALMRGMDLYTLPSQAEGISNTLLEAMASGLPSVATRVGGNAELVVEGITGQLVPAGDSAALADTLAEYVRDPARRLREGLAARRRVEEHFSLDHMVERYLAVYDEVSQPSMRGSL